MTSIKKKKLEKKIQKKLDLEDVFCIACRCIYLRPVTMPCNHTLCLECFKSMVNITAYQCPTCRRRISNWLRKYKHDWDALVNESLWKAVQLQYPAEVQKRLNDEDDGLEERIVNQGFTRVQIQQGEIKKEFDDMIMHFEQEQAERETQNIELAKKLQEEEEANKQAIRASNAELTQEDVRIASAIQQKMEEEFQQEQNMLNESDMYLAKQLQEQILESDKLTPRHIINKKSVLTQSNPPKKGPLDKMFDKLSPRNQYRNKENISSSSSSSSNTDPFQSPSTSSSFFSNPSTSSSVSYSSGIFEEESSDICSCGRLQNNFNSQLPPCQFCMAQITMLEKLTTQKNDFLMAKDLEKKLSMENYENYNLRKRSSPTQSVSAHKKIRKLTKGQQTLKLVLLEDGNKRIA